jgi:hypothetical protein
MLFLNFPCAVRSQDSFFLGSRVTLCAILDIYKAHNGLSTYLLINELYIYLVRVVKIAFLCNMNAFFEFSVCISQDLGYLT